MDSILDQCLHPASFGGTTSIVWDWRYVLDRRNFQSCALQRSDRGFATDARALHPDLDAAQAHRHSFLRRGLGGHLSGERRALLGSLERHFARRRPGNRVPFLVRQGDDRVVETRPDVGDTDRIDLLGPSSSSWWQRRLLCVPV